ncbi:unnamed protein product [Urochloa decumbens]|uniref:VWFA domain-containing protein n=1 Tax=Urochloa decumbens TaxID=240449 RepID=A0ABC8W7K7_9POAL
MSFGKGVGAWSSWMPSARIWNNATPVEVQPFPANKAVACTETRQKFPVLLRVTAAEEKKSSTPRHVGVDIVALLDISGSMMGEKLVRLKEAMNIVIDKLGPEDRLSIVPFESKVNRVTDLTYMSEKGKNAARYEIKKLVAGGENVMGEALHEGAQILRGRGEDEKSSRVGCIMFLSDGLDTDIFNADISPEFPAHTFGLGADHDPRVMKLIADKTSGTYSFVNNDVAKIKDAFELFISGLTSVAATSVEITLTAYDGAPISDISSGGCPSEKISDGRFGTIRIDNMYAGEKKNFIVYLQLQATKEGKQKLLTIGGLYKSPSSASKNLASIDVSVMRPDKNKKGSKDAAAFDPVPDVEEEQARVKLFTGISGVVPPTITAETQVSKEELEKAWMDFQDSDEGRGAPQTMKDNFEKDYEKMKSGIDSADEHKKSGLPYLMSWLTSHKWQRATTKDEPPSPESSGDFLTQRQKDHLVQKQKQDGKESEDGTTTTAEDATPTTWAKIKNQARSYLGSFLVQAVAVLLTSLLLMMLYSALEGGSMANKNIAPLQYPMLSKSNYPAWAIKMEAYMRAQGVWDAIEAKDPKQVPARKSQMALAAIYQAIPEGTLFLLSGKKTAKSAWEALKTMHIGAKRLRDAKMQTLRLEFEGLRMKEAESVDEFAVRLTTVVNKIQTLGEDIEESYVVRKFLRAVPSKFLQIASTIEQFGDLDTMTLEEVIGRLKVHEERLAAGLSAAEEVK